MSSKIECTFIFIPVIPNFIKDALESLYKYTPINFRVIVVDQTVDGIYDVVKDRADLYLRFKRTNQGFSKANNEGIIHALHWGSKYIAVCNDDILILDPRFWSGLMDQFQAFPEMYAVNPCSIIEAGWGYGLRPDGTWVPGNRCPDWGIAVDGNIYPKKPDGTAFTLKDAQTKEGYDWLLNGYKQGHIEGFAGWFVVGKREMWENIGLYDERFYPGSGEDYNLVHRIYLDGGRASSTTRSWVHHFWTKSKEALARGERLPSLSRPSFANVDALFERSPDGANSPIYPPRENEPFGNKRKLKSNGIFIDDPR